MFHCQFWSGWLKLDSCWVKTGLRKTFRWGIYCLRNRNIVRRDGVGAWKFQVFELVNALELSSVSDSSSKLTSVTIPLLDSWGQLYVKLEVYEIVSPLILSKHLSFSLNPSLTVFSPVIRPKSSLASFVYFDKVQFPIWKHGRLSWAKFAVRQVSFTF